MMKHLFLVIGLFLVLPAHAKQTPQCAGEDRACIAKHLSSVIEKIEKDEWRDQGYRELAKSMAASGEAMQALPIIAKINSPDTQALTIRGIGMQAAKVNKVAPDLFVKLHEEAAKITHPPSHGIALTYIAMAQAMAGDDSGAKATAQSMKNTALRQKAFGETAEIQAEQGKLSLALDSISMIDSVSFKNKSYKNISRIFAETEKYQQALETASYITNPVMQASAIQFILNTQETKHD